MLEDAQIPNRKQHLVNDIQGYHLLIKQEVEETSLSYFSIIYILHKILNFYILPHSSLFSIFPTFFTEVLYHPIGLFPTTITLIPLCLLMFYPVSLNGHIIVIVSILYT
jgi:hypothetical protein